MAEYIDRENIIPYSIDDDYEEYGERLIVDYKDIKEIPIANVIEQSKYDELDEKYFKAIHNHTECLKKLHELRAEIDKAKKQITDSMNEHLASDGTPIDEYAYCYLNALEILEENIGE